MRSLRQSQSSRTNGAKSRGPVSIEGKARSAANSTKHGLYAQTVVLENEDPELYAQWLDGFVAAWQPVDDHEYNLVMDIVDARWRLRRYSVLESKALDFEVGRLEPELNEAFEEIDEGTRTVFGLTSLITLNRTFEVLQTVLRAQHRIIDASRQLMDRRKVKGELPLPAPVSLTPPAANESLGNEPDPVDSMPEPTPAEVNHKNSRNEPDRQRPSAVRKPGTDPTPANWKNEPEPAVSPEVETAMQQLLDNMLREKFSPEALASIAKFRR